MGERMGDDLKVWACEREPFNRFPDRKILSKIGISFDPIAPLW